MSRELSPKVAWGILLPFLAVITLLIINKNAVQDWWHFLRYEPTTQVDLLSERADFTELGERTFFRADPEFISQTLVSERCLGADNLGCLVTGPKIYILNYDADEVAEQQQAIVTAAHEMLHMAYFRLSEDERADVNRMLDQALKKVSDARIFSILESTGTQMEYYDEAHALLGTEVKFLPLELEAHFRQYFNSRDAILEAFDKSKSLL